MPGANWTVTDIATCVKMIEAGHTYEDISSRIGRTPDSIYRKMKRHGLPMVKGEQVPVPKQDVSKVMEMHRRGKTYSEIAIATKRTRSGVAGIIHRERYKE